MGIGLSDTPLSRARLALAVVLTSRVRALISWASIFLAVLLCLGPLGSNVFAGDDQLGDFKNLGLGDDVGVPRAGL